MVSLAIGPRAMPPLPCEVRITRVAPSTLDDDNAARAAKAVRDEIAVRLRPVVIQKGKRKGQVIGDDSDPRIAWHVAQRKGAPKEYAVEVLVRHLPGDAPGANVMQGPDGAYLVLRLTPQQRARIAAGADVELPNAWVTVIPVGGDP